MIYYKNGLVITQMTVDGNMKFYEDLFESDFQLLVSLFVEYNECSHKV